jgi:hypothetical protein
MPLIVVSVCYGLAQPLQILNQQEKLFTTSLQQAFNEYKWAVKLGFSFIMTENI